ncbi:MAG: helix-turn-helix domain-containing protein [Candidatus Nanopelagicales bacterium]
MQERQSPEVGTARLLTSQQVQDLLGVDASTVYRMAADGRLPAVKIGRQWRFRADRISALLDGDTGPIPTVPGPDAAPHSAIPGPSPTPGRGPAPAAVGAPTQPRLRTEIAQPVVDAAADLLGVMMVVTDMAGRPVTHVANPCPRFAEHAADPDVITACAEEWRELAEDLDFEPRFAAGHLGFECARAFVRSGSELVGMVLVGGIAPEPELAGDDLYHLTSDRRTEVLASLRKVAVTLSRVATIDSRDDASVASPAS